MSTQEFQHLVLPYQHLLLRVTFGVLGDRMEAEDVVQEVYLKLWDQRTSLETIDNLKGWCVRLAKNQAIDRYRARQNRHEADTEQMPENGHDVTPHRIAESRDTLNHIQHLIEQLPDKQRSVLLLREIEEYSYQEIAETLDMPLNQVKVNLFRGRKALQAELKNFYSYSR